MMPNKELFTSKRFDKRDLKNGSVYYILTYFDNDMLFPEIITTVYIGSKKKHEGELFYEFRDFQSFLEEESNKNFAKEDVQIFRFAEKGLINIFDISGVIDALDKCKKRRALMGDD